MSVTPAGSLRYRAVRGLAWPLTLLLTLGCLDVTAAPPESAMPVPLKLQTTLLKKVLSYDTTLRGHENVEVLVVHGEDDGASHTPVVEALRSASFESRAVSSSQVGDSLHSGAVLYVLPGAASMTAVWEEQGVLSVTGAPDLVQSGKVVLGIGLEDGKPRILIHREQLRKSGHSLSAKLLQIATLVD